MKTVCLLALLVAFTTLPATAQDDPVEVPIPLEKPQFSVYAYGGVTRPVAPDRFSERWKVGQHMGVGIGTRVRQVKKLEIGATVTLYRFQLNRDEIIDEVSSGGLRAIAVSGGDVTSIAIGARVKYNFEENAWVKPFILVGGGMQDIALEDFTVTFDTFGGQPERDPGAQEVAFNVLFGAGLSFPIIPQVKGFFEGVYSMVLTQKIYNEETTYYMPFRLGVLWSNW